MVVGGVFFSKKKKIKTSKFIQTKKEHGQFEHRAKANQNHAKKKKKGEIASKLELSGSQTN